MQTIDPRTLDLARLEEAKQDRDATFSVLIPARGAAAAEVLPSIVSAVRRTWLDSRGIVDEIGVLVDPDSSGDEHGLVEAAERAGATWVVRGADVTWRHTPDDPHHAGKAAAMRGLALLASGTHLLFHDADLQAYDPQIVGVLAAAALSEHLPLLVNGSSPRITGDGKPGGRTTEMLRSPLSKQLWRHIPAVTELVQPLIGEFVITAELFAALPFSRGYGVETSLKVLALDRLDHWGAAQVELPVKYQVGQPYLDLVKQFHEISFTVDVLEAFFERRAVDPEITVGEVAERYEELFPARTFTLHRPDGYDDVPYESPPMFYPPLAENLAYRMRQPEIRSFQAAVRSRWELRGVS